MNSSKGTLEPYLGIVDTINKFALDMRATSRQQLDGEFPGLTPTEKLFFDSLYQDRDDEVRRILDVVHQTASTIVYVGPRGSGKTTVALRARAIAERSKQHITYLDIRSHAADLTSGDDLHLDVSNSAALCEGIVRIAGIKYKNSLFRYTRKNPGPGVAFWGYILDSQQAFARREDLYGPLYSYSETLDRMFARAGGTQDFNDWLAQQYVDDDRVATVVDEAVAKVSLAHYVDAAQSLHHYERQVLWLDNADRLPPVLQSEFVARLVDGVTEVAGSLTIVVALRNENYYRVPSSHEPDPGAHPEVVSAASRDNLRQFPAAQMAAIQPPFVSNVIMKRYEYAQTAQKDLASTSPRPNAFLPLVTNQDYGTIQRLARLVANQFTRKRESMRLANFSIRALVRLPARTSFRG